MTETRSGGQAGRRAGGPAVRGAGGPTGGRADSREGEPPTGPQEGAPPPVTLSAAKGIDSGHAVVSGFLSCVVLLACVASLPAQSLPKRLDARLDAPPFDRQLWGVALIDDKGALRYGRNPRQLFIPASNTKIIVAAVASALLPPDWTVQTSLYGNGPLAGGVLQGDLVLYGRGDPTFGKRCFATDTLREGVCETDSFTRLRELADALRKGGVREIRGDLVGDGSYFEPLTVHPGWEAFDLNWWYAAPVTALGFNDNSVDFVWGPGTEAGTPAVITMSPDVGDVVFENRTVTVPAGGRSDIGDRIYREPGTLNVWAEGTAALDRPPQTESFAMPDPNLFTARAFRQVLQQAGIAITGTTRSTTDSMLYREARTTPPLAEISSRPLHEWIFPILNRSQNWFAEMVLKQLGRQFGRAGSWTEGLAVERRFLIDSVRVDSTEFSLSDGSGLSSGNLVSPVAFTKILRFIRGHPRAGTFLAGLPRSAQVGSLRSRFLRTPLEGRVQAKDGSIGGVNSLSGFIERADGRVWTFSVQANHHTQAGRSVIQQIDSVVVEMGR
jgi:D-alanyl-D-alanine carboxypeptidase/D-alanyl-D-alanine-endopeptidase (penicillin-binding protein 4)